METTSASTPTPAPEQTPAPTYPLPPIDSTAVCKLYDAIEDRGDGYGFDFEFARAFKELSGVAEELTISVIRKAIDEHAAEGGAARRRAILQYRACSDILGGFSEGEPLVIGDLHKRVTWLRRGWFWGKLVRAGL